jgi:hypothetical protein
LCKAQGLAFEKNGENRVNNETRQLIMDVMGGNPGAFVVIRRVMYFTMWYALLCHLKERGLVGSRLWQVVKDEYGHNWTQFVTDQLAQMGYERDSGAQALGSSGSFHPN